MRLGVLTDLHFCPAGSPPDGWHNPHQFDTAAVRLKRSLQWLESQRVDRIAVLGDLTHYGDAASFAEVLQILAKSSVPIWLLAGNHDLYEDASGLSMALAEPGLESLELVGSGSVPIPSLDWSVAGLPIARSSGGSGSDYKAASSLAFDAETSTLPSLILSHFPLLGFEGETTAAGLKYSGDLVDGESITADLQNQDRPTLVLNGHLHVRHVVVDGSILQASLGGQIEPPFDATVVDFGRWPDQRRVTWTTVSMQDSQVEKLPVLTGTPQDWSWRQGVWVPTNTCL